MTWAGAWPKSTTGYVQLGREGIWLRGRNSVRICNDMFGSDPAKVVSGRRPTGR